MSRRVQPTRRRSLLVPALLVVAIAVVGFATVLVRLEITREGYRIAELRRELRELEDRNRRLRLEVAELTAHGRLREMAPRYGLGPAARGQVLTLK
jgi:cell division protein FtsL